MLQFLKPLFLCFCPIVLQLHFSLLFNFSFCLSATAKNRHNTVFLFPLSPVYFKVYPPRFYFKARCSSLPRSRNSTVCSSHANPAFHRHRPLPVLSFLCNAHSKSSAMSTLKSHSFLAYSSLRITFRCFPCLSLLCNAVVCFKKSVNSMCSSSSSHICLVGIHPTPPTRPAFCYKSQKAIAKS